MVNSRYLFTMLAGLLTTSAGCDRPAPTPQVSARSIPECDRQPDYDAAPALTARMLRLWGDDDNLQFGEIKALAVDSSGTLFVADGLQRRIVGLDLDGSSVRFLGREGSGPGEFSYPTALGILDGDTLAVFDNQQWTVTYFTTSGAYARTRHLPSMAGFGQAPAIAIARDGRIFGLSYSRYQRSVEESLAGTRQGIGHGLVGVTQLDTSSGRWVELLVTPALEVFVDLDTGTLQDVWFGAGAHLALTEGGVWTADGRGGSLILFRPAESLACRVPFPSAGVAVTPAERDSFYAARDLEYRGADRVARARDRRKAVALPETKPVIDDIVSAGSVLWVRSPQQGNDRWVAVDSNLRVYGQFSLPSDLTVLAGHRDRLYARRQTQEGVPLLVEYVLETAEGHTGARQRP